MRRQSSPLVSDSIASTSLSWVSLSLSDVVITSSFVSAGPARPPPCWPGRARGRPPDGVRGRAKPEREPERSGGPQRPLTPPGGRANTCLPRSKAPRGVDGSRGGRRNGRRTKDPRLVRKSAPVRAASARERRLDRWRTARRAVCVAVAPWAFGVCSFATGIGRLSRLLRHRDRLLRLLHRRAIATWPLHSGGTARPADEQPDPPRSADTREAARSHRSR